MRCVNEVSLPPADPTSILTKVEQATLMAIRDVRSHTRIGMKESKAKSLVAQALTEAGLASQGIFVGAQFGGTFIVSSSTLR